MTGGVIPPEVTVKVSVRHWEAKDCAAPAASSSPLVVFTTDMDDVCGPVISKLVKSSRSWREVKKNTLYLIDCCLFA